MSAIRNGILTTRTSRFKWLAGMLTTTCLLILMVAGLWNVPSLLASKTSHFISLPSTRLISLNSRQHGLVSAQLTGSGATVPEEYQQATIMTAQPYMTALFNKRYGTMWSLLDPQVQAVWPNETAFTAYWRVRFQDYTLQRFVLGKVHLLAHWVNPETMIVYSQVLEIPISLLLVPGQRILQQALAPPEDLHPQQVFQNLPFIVQRVSRVAGAVNGGKVQWLVLDGGPADLEAPILPPVQPVSTMVQVPILMYHHISDVVPPTALGMSLTITPTDFSKQLDYLKQRKYHTITFNQLFDALYYGGPLPQHPIILTFDDGYDDAFRFAFPILKAHGYSGMFYIITGKVGWAAYLNWKQIKTMFAGGMQIGSHTVHHVDMGSLVQYSQVMAQYELQKSQQVLQQRLGAVMQQFCYPSGEPFNHGTLAERQQILALLAADGYVGATTDPGMTGINQYSAAPLVLLRIRVDGRSTLPFFMNSLPW